METKRFFQYEIIINVLVSSSPFLSIHMLWLYRHFKLLILSVRGPFSDVRICLSICLISVHITLCILLRRWFRIDPALCQCIVCRGWGRCGGGGASTWFDLTNNTLIAWENTNGANCRAEWKKQNAYTHNASSDHCTVFRYCSTPPPPPPK